MTSFLFGSEDERDFLQNLNTELSDLSGVEGAYYLMNETESRKDPLYQEPAGDQATDDTFDFSPPVKMNFIIQTFSDKFQERDVGGEFERELDCWILRSEWEESISDVDWENRSEDEPFKPDEGDIIELSGGWGFWDIEFVEEPDDAFIGQFREPLYWNCDLSQRSAYTPERRILGGEKNG